VSNGTAILVAEDDPCDILLFKRAFSQTGIKTPIVFVRDGQEVIDYLMQEPPFDDSQVNPWPRLIVLDLVMPRVSGFEVLAWLQREPALRHIPVIAFSGLQRPTDISRAYSLGAKFFLLKTYRVEQLSMLLHRLADLHGLTREPQLIAPSWRPEIVGSPERSVQHV